MAFLYETYYCHGPKLCFAGVYSDTEDALEHIRGSRYAKVNLELVDTDSYEFTEYIWYQKYKVEKDKLVEKYPLYGKEAKVIDCSKDEKYPPEFNDGYWRDVTGSKEKYSDFQ